MSLKAKILTGVFAAAVLGVGADYVYNMAYDYSDGSRTGQVFKLSHKGSLCKTWEGQMMTDGYGRVQGQGNTMSFEFTVMDKSLLPQIEAAKNSGEHVSLQYRQVKWPIKCLQESEYVVTAISKVDGEGHTSPFIIAAPAPRR